MMVDMSRARMQPSESVTVDNLDGFNPDSTDNSLTVQVNGQRKTIHQKQIFAQGHITREDLTRLQHAHLHDGTGYFYIENTARQQATNTLVVGATMGQRALSSYDAASTKYTAAHRAAIQREIEVRNANAHPFATVLGLATGVAPEAGIAAATAGAGAAALGGGGAVAATTAETASVATTAETGAGIAAAGETAEAGTALARVGTTAENAAGRALVQDTRIPLNLASRAASTVGTLGRVATVAAVGGALALVAAAPSDQAAHGHHQKHRGVLRHGSGDAAPTAAQTEYHISHDLIAYDFPEFGKHRFGIYHLDRGSDGKIVSTSSLPNAPQGYSWETGMQLLKIAKADPAKFQQDVAAGKYPDSWKPPEAKVSVAAPQHQDTHHAAPAAAAPQAEHKAAGRQRTPASRFPAPGTTASA